MLGNFHQRKMYDRGMLGVSQAATPAEAEEYSKKFYESRQKRQHVPTGTGRTPIYNFDEWSKLHYESSRQRRENAKERYEKKVQEKIHDEEEKRAHSVISILLLSATMGIFYFVTSAEHDTPKRNMRESDNRHR